MKITVKKGNNTFIVTSQPQLDAFKADGYTEVEEVEEDTKKENQKRKQTD